MESGRTLPMHCRADGIRRSWPRPCCGSSAVKRTMRWSWSSAGGAQTMRQATAQFDRQYARTLLEYVRGPVALSLHAAYELGRSSLVDGLGVLEVSGSY